MTADHDDAEFLRHHRKFVQAWDAEPPARPAGWRLKRLLVCWWRHRTRRIGPGLHYSTSCRACHDR